MTQAKTGPGWAPAAQSAIRPRLPIAWSGDVVASLARVRRPEGPQGPEGPEGKKGDPGVDGERGAQGERGPVNFSGLARAGEMVQAEIHSASSQTLTGEESLLARAGA